MDRAISRRDLLQGMGALAAGALCTPSNQIFALENTGATGYPPALTGFRGSHVGSFEVAHQLALTGRRDWGTVQGTDDELFDPVYEEDDDERYPLHPRPQAVRPYRDRER